MIVFFVAFILVAHGEFGFQLTQPDAPFYFSLLLYRLESRGYSN